MNLYPQTFFSEFRTKILTNVKDFSKMEIIIIILVSLLEILIYFLIGYPDRSIGTKPRTVLNGPKGLPILNQIKKIDGFFNGIWSIRVSNFTRDGCKSGL